jgi:hypothetical protein
MGYARSKHVIKVNDFDHLNFWEGKDVDVSISSKKIKIILHGNYSKHLVVYIPNINVFVFFYIQGLHISASTLSDFVRHLAPVRWPVSRSLVSDVCTD